MKTFNPPVWSDNVIIILILSLTLPVVRAIWPPPYSVNLSHEETFVISELLEKSDVQDVYDEEELIQKEDLAERLSIRSRDEKYFRIHQQVRRYNDKLTDDSGYNRNQMKVFQEFNPDIEESAPFKAGFVDEEGKFKPEEDIIYFDEPNGNLLDNKPKRSDEDEDKKEKEVNYDYKNFKAEYEAKIKAAQNASDTLKYSTVKEEESVKDSVKKMVDFKETPRNCTAEEMKGIGFGAAKCFWLEMERPRMKSRVFEKVVRFIIIWVIIYVVVAIPCWCQYGWCCCCCRFKFCRPRENIAGIQKIFAENPVGTYHDEKGNVFTYKPTGYERYAYRKLEHELNKL